MFCATCGTAVRGDARYCTICGSALTALRVATAHSQEIATRFCPSCGLVGPASADYCAFCGGCTHCGHVGAGAHALHPAPTWPAQSPRPVGTPYADFGSRFAAHVLIDGAVTFGIFALIGILSTALGDGAAWLGMAGWFGYLWWGNATGQTLGKRALGIRVVQADTGAMPGWGRGLARTVGYGISSMFFWLGYLWAAWDDRRRAWHDTIAGTVVIRDDPKPKEFVPRTRGW